MQYNELINKILAENEEVLLSVDESKFDRLVSELLDAEYVLCYAAGRMGLSLKAFSMRLNHLGIKSSFLTDNYVPPVKNTSVYLTLSGSGKTPSVVNFTKIAKDKDARIISITGDDSSPLAQLSDLVITFKSCNGGLNSMDSNEKINSIQPMSTLNEQATGLLLDIVALKIIEASNMTPQDFIPRHSNIE